jgi:nucleoside-diphosphate-sugar epimerase
MQNKMILVAGATGNLGERIVRALLHMNIPVRILTRESSNKEKVIQLENLGAQVFTVDMNNVEEISNACLGVSCIVSAIAGLKDVVIDQQKRILDAAIKAGVPRFIPSDYSLDFIPFKDGENRNLDWRREFHKYLDKQAIKATSIFNGAFADMLTKEMPLILFKKHKIFFWGNEHQLMNFTYMDDVAHYTALVAIDDHSPRYLHIASSQLCALDFKNMMTELSGKKYSYLRPGGLGLFKIMIKLTQFFSPSKNELYPAWQGMQYMHNMLDARSIVNPLDNDRYDTMKWTNVKDVLKEYLKNNQL